MIAHFLVTPPPTPTPQGFFLIKSFEAENPTFNPDILRWQITSRFFEVGRPTYNLGHISAGNLYNRYGIKKSLLSLSPYSQFAGKSISSLKL